MEELTQKTSQVVDQSKHSHSNGSEAVHSVILVYHPEDDHALEECLPLS